MIFPALDKFAFGARLNQVVSPAAPVRSIEHLLGRAKELDRIEKALMLDGRNIFIYGDRGVGKSSLAATAAVQYQSSEADPIQVACSPDVSFRDVIANIAYEAIKASRISKTKQHNKTSLETRYLKHELSVEKTQNDIRSEIHSVVDAVDVLSEVAAIHSERPIVVIDEFDRMEDSDQRKLFADLVKQLGDRNVKLKIIFTGVGKSLIELLGAHESAIRQLDTIMLPQLPWEARYEIVDNALKSLGLEIDPDIRVRIAAVSDGFPSYVHKITEKILWAMFDDPNVVHTVSWNHYHQALNDAIAESYASFSQKYERVVNQRNDDYEEVLWSTADSEYLRRYLADMFASYEYIMNHRQGRPRLSYDKYCARIRTLKNKACGEILIPDRTHRGMYEYRESIFRGYVRMQAEAHGIQLIGVSRPAEQRAEVKVPTSANRGYFASTPPKGVTLDRSRKKQ